MRFDISTSRLLTQKKGRPGEALPHGERAVGTAQAIAPDQSPALTFLMLSNPA